MEYFLVRQPNGLLCKVSILTLKVIRDDITDEEYVEECVKREREWTRYILENHLEPLTIKPTAREDFETRIEINAEAARREAKSVLKGCTDYNRFGECLMNEVMTRERLEEWLQEANEVRKRLCGTIKKVVNILDSICKEIVKVSQEISKDDVRRQNCLEGKFCAHCKYYQEESATYACKNECSELFNKNLAPFQTCRYFSKNSESYYNDGWILCKDRMPEIGKAVLVCDKQGNVCVREITCEIKGKKYWSQNKNDVVAWRPLPEPFNEKCKNQNGGMKNE